MPTSRHKTEDWTIGQECVHNLYLEIIQKIWLKEFAFKYIKLFPNLLQISHPHYLPDKIWNHYPFPVYLSDFFLMVHVPLATNTAKLHPAGQLYPDPEPSPIKTLLAIGTPFLKHDWNLFLYSKPESLHAWIMFLALCPPSCNHCSLLPFMPILTPDAMCASWIWLGFCSLVQGLRTQYLESDEDGFTSWLKPISSNVTLGKFLKDFATQFLFLLIFTYLFLATRN